ncbi:PQQ-binding-like beta-propeller repeat protein [Streptomyces sp. BI20]|uniref:outer membrane protein assembly factor BamB family protein n=1 Tax=Streptomyces sp. BI20 TaxID=3403460 RepID=UPI003C74A3C3
MPEQPPPPNQPPVPEGYGHLPGPPPGGQQFPPAGPNPYAQPAPGATPGYGYPQSSPQQPPTTPAGPGYGYPQQPPTAPGYGYPPHQPATGPGGPGGSGGSGGGKGRRNAIIAAGTVGLLLVGLGSWFVFGTEDEKPAKPVAAPSTPAAPKPSGSATPDAGDGKGTGAAAAEFNEGRAPDEGRVNWLKINDIQLPGGGGDSWGQWIIGDTVVKSLYKSVTAYGLADGKVRWNLELPTAPCGMTSQATKDGKIVAAFKNGTTTNADCNQMRMLDLTKGTAGWTKEVPKESMFDMMTTLEMVIAGDVVAVSRTGPSSGFKVSTGEKVWVRKGEEKCPPYKYASDGTTLVNSGLCSVDKQNVQGADPLTGKTTWTWTPPGDYKVDRFYSVDPVIVDVSSEKTKKRGVVVLNSDGTQRSQLRADGDFTPKCGYGINDRGLQNCRGVAVDKATNTLFMATSFKIKKANEIVAFDLTTGQAKWRESYGNDRTLMPLSVTDGKLNVYLEATKTAGGQLLTIPVSGGSFDTVLKNPVRGAAVESGFRDAIVQTGGGHLVVGTSWLLGEGSNGKEKVLMVFGK